MPAIVVSRPCPATGARVSRAIPACIYCVSDLWSAAVARNTVRSYRAAVEPLEGDRDRSCAGCGAHLRPRYIDACGTAEALLAEED